MKKRRPTRYCTYPLVYRSAGFDLRSIRSSEPHPESGSGGGVDERPGAWDGEGKNWFLEVFGFFWNFLVIFLDFFGFFWDFFDFFVIFLEFFGDFFVIFLRIFLGFFWDFFVIFLEFFGDFFDFFGIF